jgi:hypothetical protein
MRIAAFCLLAADHGVCIGGACSRLTVCLSVCLSAICMFKYSTGHLCLTIVKPKSIVTPPSTFYLVKA